MFSFFNRLKTRLGAISVGTNQQTETCLNSDAQTTREQRKSSSGAPVTVNVYDMFGLNSLGIGVYHTGVVIYGTEYCYGGHPFSYSGIFAMTPQDCSILGVNYSFRTSIVLGKTDFTAEDVTLILEDIGPKFPGDQYNLLHRNCNHFSDAFVQFLCGASLPKWINRLATIGAKFPIIERSIPRMWLTPLPLETHQQELRLLSRQSGDETEEEARDSPVRTRQPMILQSSRLLSYSHSQRRGRKCHSFSLPSRANRQALLPRTVLNGLEPGDSRHHQHQTEPPLSSRSSSQSSCSTNCRGKKNENDSPKSRWSLLFSSCLPQLRSHPVEPTTRSKSLVLSSRLSSTSLPEAASSEAQEASHHDRMNSSAGWSPTADHQRTSGIVDGWSEEEESTASRVIHSCTQALVRFQSLCGTNGTGSDSPPPGHSPTFYFPTVGNGVAVNGRADKYINGYPSIR